MKRAFYTIILTLILALPWPTVSVALCGQDDFAKHIEKLKSQSSEERRDAVEALGLLEDKRVIEPLLGVLKDSSPDVRAAAINALSFYEDPRAIDPLIALLKDEVAFVRSAAARVEGATLLDAQLLSQRERPRGR